MSYTLYTTFPKGELAILLINETGEISYQFHSTLF